MMIELIVSQTMVWGAVVGEQWLGAVERSRRDELIASELTVWQAVV